MNPYHNQPEKDSITLIYVMSRIMLALITIVAGYGLAVMLMSF